MDKLLGALKAASEQTDLPEVNRETLLRTIPGWDSMRAVNFQLELEAAFSVDLADFEFSEDTTVGDVADALTRKGVAITPATA